MSSLGVKENEMAGEGVAVLIWKEFWIKYVMGTYCLVKGDQIGWAGERGGEHNWCVRIYG